jgi:hypothetical protein
MNDRAELGPVNCSSQAMGINVQANHGDNCEQWAYFVPIRTRRSEKFARTYRVTRRRRLRQWR